MININVKRKKIITLISIFVLVTIISGFLFYNVRANGTTNEEMLFNNLEPFFETLNLVRFEYVKKKYRFRCSYSGGYKRNA